MITTQEYDRLGLTSVRSAPAASALWAFRYGYNDAVGAGSEELYQRLRCAWPDGSYCEPLLSKLGVGGWAEALFY